ncbi:hypothetical protein PanWU01x14_208770 [Parasponia andersonii]|uniref:Uncharacterized protein n=1 Tax=Parasponia andersonii TaxID=3476 RepID=A0A2P5BUM7_PARAD|nr:hypothetical protein PanWU01x14_208770 [Parasponia andersonii]
MKRWHKDAKSNSHVHIHEPSTQQEERIQLSKYGALNSEANTMIYYTSKVEASYKTAKDEIARLTALFKSAFETSSASNNNSSRTPGMGLDTPAGTVKRSRICRIYYGIGHDARNCMEKDRVRSSRGGLSSSKPTSKQRITPGVDNVLDSSQQSMNT